MFEMAAVLAQTTQQTGDSSVQITLPVAITFAGIIGIVLALVKIGDRLWGNKPRNEVKDTSRHDEVIDLVRNSSGNCDRKHERLVENINRLSEAMTKYIELQQASLKLEEYRHETVLKTLASLENRVDEVDKKRIDDMRNLNTRLDAILQGMIHPPKTR